MIRCNRLPRLRRVPMVILCTLAALSLEATPIANATNGVPTTPSTVEARSFASPDGATSDVSSGAAGACPETTPDYLGACGPVLTLPQWTDFSGWDKPSEYSTIQLRRISGKPGAELLGRDSVGLWVERFDAELGQWASVPTADRGVNLLLPDFGDWDRPGYYATIQAADVGGDGQAELLVRAANGLVTHNWNEATGHFEAIAGSTLGDLADEKGFSKPEQYETIQTADIFGDGKAELLARGSDGLHTYRWTLNHWEEAGPVLPMSDAAGWKKPQYYQTIRTADIDGDGKAELLARAADGLHTWRWSNGWTDTGYILRSLDDDHGWDKPQYYQTIQTAELNGDGKKELLTRARDGLHTYQWSQTKGWQEAPYVLQDLSDNAAWDKVGRWETIQTADLDGTRKAKVLARAGNGINVWQLGGDGWTRIAAGTPKLADSPWSQALYYKTIQTADIDGSGRAALIARGPFGIRTFIWNPKTQQFERPRPYHAFPSFSGDQQAAYDALSVFLLGGPPTDFREATYANPSKTIADDLLSSYRARLAERCTPITSADLPEPPRYTDCRPPADSNVPAAAWTAVSNQIIAELWAAAAVGGYFSTLQQVQTAQFQDNQGTLPALDAELKLPPPTKDVAPSYLKLAKSGVELVADFLNLLPAGRAALLVKNNPWIARSISTLAHAMGAVAEGLGLQSTPSPASSWAKITTEVAKLQQKERDITEAQRRYVSADYGLLMTFGSEVQAQLLTLDRTAMLSASRQSFAEWVYQMYLPAYWRRFDVKGCYNGIDRTCTIPTGPNVRADNERSTFVAILPDTGSGCDNNWLTVSCYWASPGELGGRLWSPTSDSCTYDPTPGSTAAWRYGCAIGADASDLIDRKNGWQFGTTECVIETFKVGHLCKGV